MALLILSILVLNCLYYEVKGVIIESEKVASTESVKQDKNDLNSDASTYYSSRHSEWTNNYPNSYENRINGYGLVENKKHNGYNTIGSSDNYYQYDNNYVGSSDNYIGYNTRYNYRGNGGYGGYGGNGGLSSYYGYNSPNYHGAYHLGYGYYNRRPGYGNIYNNGITPNLVTGYRGYSKK